MERKLAAILAADVAGYSRLMGADEEGTFDALRRHREVVEQLIAEHHGRVFNTAGDSIIAAFPSAVEATDCAVAIQQEIARRNGSVPVPKRLEFRIGINIGDVIAESGDMFGDGVNLADRLQKLAEPGGICVSRNVYEQVRNKHGIRFEALGRHHVKNIAEPVSVYRVLTELSVARPALPRLLRSLTRRRSWLTATVIALAILGGGIWLALPHAPSSTGNATLAVLPFANMSNDAATGLLADGITEDVITDLARFRDLEIIARNSTMIYKDKPVNVRQVSNDLNVDYVLEGSIQRRAGQIRITAQLVDARADTYLWSERWDRPVEDTFAVQTEVAERVAGTLGSVNGAESISADILRKAKRRPPASLSAYEYYLLAVEAKGAFTRDSLFAAVNYASKAIALDPGFARAYAVRARARYNTTHYGADFETAMQEMEADARRAIDLDPNEPEGHAALAWCLTLRGRLAESENEIRATLQTNPVNESVLIVAAAILSGNGHPEEGAQLADKVLRIDPRATAASLNTIKDAYYFSHRFTDAIAVISRIAEDARSRGSRLFLTFSYALLNRPEEAMRARAELLEKYPSISAELLLNQDWSFVRQQDEDLFLQGFRASGLPLCASDADLAKIARPKRLPECANRATAD